MTRKVDAEALEKLARELLVSGAPSTRPVAEELLSLVASAHEEPQSDALREAVNKRANEFYGSGASSFSIDSRELAAKQCIAEILEIVNRQSAPKAKKETLL